MILEIGGQTVSKPADVRAGLEAAQKAGKKAVLLRIKSKEGTACRDRAQRQHRRLRQPQNGDRRRTPSPVGEPPVQLIAWASFRLKGVSKPKMQECREPCPWGIIKKQSCRAP